MENNYYEWLRMPVESFDYDSEELMKVYEKRIGAWKSSNNIQLQNRANIYQEEILSAIKDQEKWKKLYLAYKKRIDSEIYLSLLCIDKRSNRIVTPENVKKIADYLGIKEEYVLNVASQKGYIVIESVSYGLKASISYRDLEPSKNIKLVLKEIQKDIEELGFESIESLINEYNDVDINIQKSSKEEILELLNGIKNFWAKKNLNKPDMAAKKSLYEKISVAMISFLKDNDIKSYVEFLRWRKINEKLVALENRLKKLEICSINETVFNGVINDIYIIMEKKYDRDYVMAIVESFCNEKKIVYP